MFCPVQVSVRLGRSTGLCGGEVKSLLCSGKLCLSETCMNSNKRLDKIIEAKSNIPQRLSSPEYTNGWTLGEELLVLSFSCTLSLASVAWSQQEMRRGDWLGAAAVTGGYCVITEAVSVP